MGWCPEQLVPNNHFIDLEPFKLPFYDVGVIFNYIAIIYQMKKTLQTCEINHSLKEPFCKCDSMFCIMLIALNCSFM